MRTESKENLVESQSSSENNLSQVTEIAHRPNKLENEFDYAPEIILTPTEKRFLLTAERGDCATVKKLLEEFKDNPEELNINCTDPLERSALIAAIENENSKLANNLKAMAFLHDPSRSFSNRVARLKKLPRNVEIYFKNL